MGHVNCSSPLTHGLFRQVKYSLVTESGIHYSRMVTTNNNIGTPDEISAFLLGIVIL